MTDSSAQYLTLEQALSQRARQQAAVAELGQRALIGTELSALMNEIAERVTQTLEVEYCKILELLPDQGTLLLRAGVGWKPGLVGHVTVGSGLDSQAGYTLASSEPVIVEDLHTETRFTPTPLLVDHGVVSGMGVIIQGREHPWGILSIHTRAHRTFNHDDVNFLQSVANVLAAAIERKRVEAALVTLNADLERRVAERTGYIRLLQEAAVAANQASSPEAAFQFVLDRVCAHTGWPLGHVYLYQPGPDGEKVLTSTNLWHIQDRQRFAAFVRETEATTLKTGIGLPGRVLASARSAWITDISRDPNFTRASSAVQAGIKAAFAFPVLAGEEVVAVLEFFAVETVRPDEPLLEVMSNIGTQLGRVVERQRAEAMLLRSNEELRQSQEQLAEAQKLAHIGSWDWDIPSGSLRWSAELYRIYGIDPQQFPSTYEGWLEMIHPEDRATVRQVIEKAQQTRLPFEIDHRILRPDGSVRIIYAQGKVVEDDHGRPIKMVGTGQDITDRRRMEEALRQSLALLENLFESAPDGTVLVDEDGKILRLNRQMEQLFGYHRQELIGMPLDFLLPERYQQRHVRHRLAFAKDPRRRPMGAGLELYGRRKDGSEFPVDIMLSPLETRQGIQVIAVVRDITERRRAEEALRASEARFRSFFESSAMGIALVDSEWRLLMSNPRLSEILGYSPAELRGMVSEKVTHPADQPSTQNLYREVFEGSRDVAQLEKRYLRKDGEMIWGRLTVSLVRDANGQPSFAIAMLEDITARKQMEEELAELQHRLMVGREQERMRLAQELHDVPIQELYALLYQLNELDDAAHDPQRLETLKKEQAEAIRQVISTLRSIMGELRSPTLAPFGLQGALREHAEQFQAKYPQLSINLDLMADDQELPEEVRLNLFRICQQALSNVARHAQATQVSVRFKFDEEQVLLEVEDNGRGFEVPNRWISLAREGHLGLVGSAERAEMIGGRFQVVSKTGSGTCVRVIVPRRGVQKDLLKTEGLKTEGLKTEGLKT